MKRSSSAPCLAGPVEKKRTKTAESQKEPNAKEYLQMALDRILELQREIKEDAGVVNSSDNTSDLGDSGNEEDVIKEVMREVFENLPGTSKDLKTIIERTNKSKDRELEEIRGKRFQLLGYETCRLTALEFMKNQVREMRSIDHPRNDRIDNRDFHYATFNRNDPRIAFRRTGLLRDHYYHRDIDLSDQQQIRMRMLRSLDLHLAVKQRDYTARLMRL